MTLLAAGMSLRDNPAVNDLQQIVEALRRLAERAEARDLFDIGAVLQAHPELEPFVRAILRRQDAILLAERLLSWSDADIEKDLTAYTDVPPQAAITVRDRLLHWLAEDAQRQRAP